MKFITAIAAACLCASAAAQVQIGKGVQLGSGAATVTAPAMQSATSSLTGCATAGNAWNPATNTCTPASGGGGGTGIVVPSPQFKMGYYPNVGSVATVQGDSGSTTDGNGNLSVTTVTGTVNNRVNSLAARNTLNSTLPPNADGTGEAHVLNRSFLNFSGYGKSIGNISTINPANQGWRVAVGNTIEGSIFGAGIHQLFATNAKKWGIGDFAEAFFCANAFGCFSGGFVTPSDQGSQAILVSSTQFINYYHGTVTATTGLGDTSPVISAGSSQFGGEAIIGGGYLINTSKTILTANLTGATSTSWEGGILGLLPISGGATPSTGMCQLTAILNASTVLGVPQSQPLACTTHDGLPIVTGNAWIATNAGEPFEQVTVTVSGSCTVVGNCTILSATPHPVGAIIFQGGTQGSLSMDDDLATLGNTTDFPVLGATDATHLIIGFPGNSAGAVGLPFSGIMYQSLTSGIHVFASARITYVGTDGLTNHVEINKVNWQVGDNLVSPTPSSFLESGVAVVSTAHTQQNPSNPSLGLAVSTQGPVSIAYRPINWSNNFGLGNGFTQYIGYGGRLIAPAFLTQVGPQSNFATIDDPLGGGDCGTATLLCDKNSGSHTHDLALYIDKQASHAITMHRSIGQIEFQDNIKTQNILMRNSGGGNGQLSFGAFYGNPAIYLLDQGTAGHRAGIGLTGSVDFNSFCYPGLGSSFTWKNGGDFNAGTTLMSLGCDTGALTAPSGGITGPVNINPVTGTTNGTISFGANYGADAIDLFTNGTIKDGLGLNAGEMQFYLGNSGALRYSFNIGTGGLQASGVGELFELNTVTDATQLRSSGAYGWTGSATTSQASLDTGLSRPAAGVVSVDTTATGNGLGTVKAAAFQGTGTNPKITTGTASNTDVNGHFALSAATTAGPYTWANVYTTAPEVTLQPYFDIGSGNRCWVTFTGVTSFTINCATAVTGTIGYIASGHL